MSRQNIEAVDLYCGAGGLTYGLQQASIKVLAGVDIDANCRFAYEKNNGSEFIGKDVKRLSGDDLTKRFSKGAIKLLAGCAPCQPFSSYTNGIDPESHSKWALLNEFERLVLELDPELVTMENVPQLAAHKPFDDFVRTLDDLGYAYDWQIVDCADYGVPQHRKRLVLVASRLGEIKVPKPVAKARVTVRNAIGGLPTLQHGMEDQKDKLHKASKLSELNLKRIRASRPGGTWRDWPKALVAKCHVREEGQSYAAVYGRMSWDAPAPTMTTLCFGFGNGRFGHPEQDRGISLREAALLQSFPKNYRFVDGKQTPLFKVIGRMIGNAVPPALGKAVGLSLITHVRQYTK